MIKEQKLKDLYILLRLPFMSIFLSMLMLNMPYYGVLRVLRIGLGIVGLIFIPGYCIVNALLGNSSNKVMDTFSLGLILGLALQIFNVLILYSTVSLILNRLEFGSTIVFMTVLECSALQIYYVKKYKGNALQTSCPLAFKIRDYMPLILFILALSIRLFYQQFIEGPMTDGSLYLDQARQLVSTGSFTSKTINNCANHPFAYQLGFNFHAGAYFAHSIFFLLGGISFSSAKLMTSFVGSLLVLSIYSLTYHLFDRKTAIIASLLATLHPLLVTMSSIVQGPEILSSLFILTSILFLVAGLKQIETKNIAFSGFLMAIAFICWIQDFHIVLFAIPILIAANASSFKDGLKRFIYALLLCACLESIIQFNMYPQIFIILLISTLVLILSLYLHFRKHSLKERNILIYFILILVVFSIYTIRSYAHPEVFIETARTVDVRVNRLYQFSEISNTFNKNFSNLESAVSKLLFYLFPLTVFLMWKRRKLLYILPILLSYSILQPLYTSTLLYIPYNFRFYIVPVSLIIISVSACLGALVEWLPIVKKIKLDRVKSYIRVPKNTVAFINVLLLIVFFFLSTYSQYSNYANYINQKWINYNRLNWSPAFEWILDNTSPKDVIISAKPNELAWYTNRLSIRPRIRYESLYTKPLEDVDLHGLISNIQQFNVNYLLVDGHFRNVYPKLLFLYENNAPPGFEFGFSSTHNGNKVIIYNVTEYGRTD